MIFEGMATPRKPQRWKPEKVERGRYARQRGWELALAGSQRRLAARYAIASE